MTANPSLHFLKVAAVLFGLTSLILCLLAAAMTGGFRKAPWSLADQLPPGVEALETFTDRTGMDSFFLVKARYSSEDNVSNICENFLLAPSKPDASPLSFAGLWDEKSNIDWFPLPNVTRRFEFNSVNDDGTIKEGASGRYESVLWIDDQTKEFVIQMACM